MSSPIGPIHCPWSTAIVGQWTCAIANHCSNVVTYWTNPLSMVYRHCRSLFVDDHVKWKAFVCTVVGIIETIPCRFVVLVQQWCQFDWQRSDRFKNAMCHLLNYRTVKQLLASIKLLRAGSLRYCSSDSINWNRRTIGDEAASKEMSRESLLPWRTCSRTCPPIDERADCRPGQALCSVLLLSPVPYMSATYTC
jgi:hypothetical protein